MSAPDRIWVTYNAKAIATDMPRFHSDVEYTRLDPNTRVVTVEKLERWFEVLSTLKHGSHREIRAIIGEVKP